MGNWKNLMEMEESLTLDELDILIKIKRERDYDDKKFMAALKGIDLEDNSPETKFEDVKHRAEAAIAGVSEDEYVFDMIGIEIENE